MSRSDSFRAAGVRQAGFSMIELMVAMTVSLILLGGALSLLYSSKVTYYENERVARNQEGGRTAIELILRDLRAAGYPGCAQPVSGLFSANNRLANSSSILWRFDLPIQGFEGSNGTWAPAIDTFLSSATPAPSTKNDIVVVRTIRTGAPQFRTIGYTNPTADIVVSKSANQSISAGTTFVINDCGNESFFAATPVATTDTTATFLLSTGGTAPTNQSSDLLASFEAGAQVSPVDTLIYYVAPSATPSTQGGQAGPALWRIIGNQSPEEVIGGVERMEVQYGVDTSGDTVVDQYSNADVVNSAGNWSNVVSIRIAVLVRSAEPNAPEADTKTYTLLDSSAGPFNDRYERSVFMTTATLRNRTT